MQSACDALLHTPTTNKSVRALRIIIIVFVLPLIVSVGGVIAVQWLWHAVPDFYASHPRVTIAIGALVLLYAAVLTYRIRTVGLHAVVFGDPNWRAKRASRQRRM
jgi:hypothetical protein